MKRQDYLNLGGFDERFVSPGEDWPIWMFFKRVHEDSRYSPVMLLGEAHFISSTEGLPPMYLW